MIHHVAFEIRPDLIEAEGRFWAAAGGPTAPPRDLQGAISLALPVTTVTLPALALGRIERWLLARGIEHRFDSRDRRLRGCLVATGGYGFIFVDGADPEDERRFTLAHETAHFLLDYQVPQAVLKLKQGFGRLIRTATDRGIVVLFDPRVLTKGYGRRFLEALPDCRRFVDGVEE